MKRNLLGLFAVVIAIAFSAFTVKKTTSFYYIYDSGVQSQISSYQAPTLDVQDAIDGADVLAWMKVEAESINGPVQAEFDATFAALDTDNDLTLNDESEDHVNLEKRIED